MLLLLATLQADAAPATSGPSVSCAADGAPGGEWPSLNGDLANSRHQPDEATIGREQVRDLRPAWSFAGASVGATGGMRSTPIIAGGCVYIGFGQGYLGDRGDVVALDADTGAVVWHTQLDGSVLGLAASNGLIYATPSSGTRGEVALPVVTDTYKPAGSYAVALDARTGELRWTSERLDDGNAANGTFVNASPVVFEAERPHRAHRRWPTRRRRHRSMLFVPLAGGAGDGARVPMYFLDARTGETIARAFTLTEGEYRAGFGGTGIWSTAAYDPTRQYLYVGTADSDGRTRQHAYNNAILRIDANPRRRTFAKVVGAYSGTSEHADLDPLIGYPTNPACGLAPGGTAVDLPTFFDTSASVECLELDFDFGASPNLSTAADGRLRVSALQKSGIFHSVDATTMRAAWTAFVGPGGPAMDAGTASIAGGRIHVGASPNLLFGFDHDGGAVDWVSTTGVDVFAYQPLTTANGVLYAINDLGALLAVDADTGQPLLDRSIASDGGFTQCLGVGAGVAVARGTVFVPCDAGGLADLAGLPSPPGGLVAYRLP
jgi:outer membrane protein assembly factor BamB